MTCELCGEVMLTGRSCVPGRSLVYGRGEPDERPTCRDCGVKPGGYHHVGCCVAVCATCGRQSLRIPAFDAWQESCRCLVQ
jgi:hypothetical protein